MLRISMALPEYPDLEDLLDYVSGEVKRLMEAEGALIALHDEETGEVFFLGAAYDDPTVERRVKEIRFPLDGLVAGKVIQTGRAMIVADPSGDPQLSAERDRKLGYHTRNLLLVPLKSRDRNIGVLCAVNKKEGDFDDTHVEFLNTMAGTVALSIENARFAEELKTAYRELSSLDRAKDKVINHLSHELKTPVSVLAGAFNILAKRLTHVPREQWMPTVERAKRNLDRIMDIQSKTEDIIRERHYTTHDLLSLILDQCGDELETLIAEEVGEGPVIRRIRDRIDDIFAPTDMVSESIDLEHYVRERLDDLSTAHVQRHVEIFRRLEPAPPVFIPKEALRKVVDGLIKNAVENTPDGGQMEVMVRPRGEGTELVVRDFGVGITEESQMRIFEGFFSTRETMDYSSGRPFEFNAGGKGVDLLRAKIFSERYGFQIRMESTRCRHIPQEGDPCPGRISDCPFCSKAEACHESGGTTFTLYFPPASKG
jgi:signal transduction histidine kinase